MCYIKTKINLKYQTTGQPVLHDRKRKTFVVISHDRECLCILYKCERQHKTYTTVASDLLNAHNGRTGDWIHNMHCGISTRINKLARWASRRWVSWTCKVHDFPSKNNPYFHFLFPKKTGHLRPVFFFCFSDFYSSTNRKKPALLTSTAWWKQKVTKRFHFA